MYSFIIYFRKHVVLVEFSEIKTDGFLRTCLGDALRATARKSRQCISVKVFLVSAHQGMFILQ